MFPDKEEEITVPLVQHHKNCCWRIWKITQRALLRMNKQYANNNLTPTPDYELGQNVWLSTKNIPFMWESRKMASQCITKKNNPVTIRL